LNLNKHIRKKPQNSKEQNSLNYVSQIISANKASQSIKLAHLGRFNKKEIFKIVQRAVMSVININIFVQVPLMSKSEVNKVGN
jgi:hypothetical protein